MATDTDFITAISADPDSDAPRLEYARYLQEQGNRRGEFIELQVQAARLPAGSEDRLELEQRADRLRKRYPRAWTRALEDLKARDCVFHRGLVEGITINLGALEANAAKLLELAPLRHLVLIARAPPGPRAKSRHLFQRLVSLKLDPSCGAFGLLPWICTHAHLRRLRSLSLSALALHQEDLLLLAQAPWLRRLQRLDLSSCRRTTTHATAWLTALLKLPLPALTDLNLSGCELGNEVAQRLDEAAWPKLRRLDLSGNNLDNEGASSLLGATLVRRLKELNLRNNRIGPAGCALEKLPVRLDLSGNDLYHRLQGSANDRLCGYYLMQAEVKALDAAGCFRPPSQQGWASDTVPRFQRCSLYDTGLMELLRCADLASFPVLDLSENNLMARECQALAECPHLEQLHTLILTGNPIGDDGLRLLVQSPLWSRLRRLDVTSCGIGPAGVCALASAASSSLEELVLVNNPVKDEGVAHLAQARSLPQLTHLNLGITGLGAAGAPRLAQTTALTSLQALELGGNALDDEALLALAAGPWHHLSHLSVSGTIHLEAVTALLRNPEAELQSLSLNGVRFEGDQLHAIRERYTGLVTGASTSHAEGLLHAIHDDPDNDDLRLMYADLLEEQGDPWAEGIRVQIELTRRAPDDPQRQELEQRERGLLHAHSRAWLEPMVQRLNFTFHRGFPEALRIWGASGLEEETALRLYPIRELSVELSYHGATAPQITCLLEMPQLDQLHTLTVVAGEEWDPSGGKQVFGPPSVLGLAEAQALAAAPQLARLQALVLRGFAVEPQAHQVLQLAFGTRLQIS